MTLAENLADLEMHARHFADRRGFTYTVLDPVLARRASAASTSIRCGPAEATDADAASEPRS